MEICHCRDTGFSGPDLPSPQAQQHGVERIPIDITSAQMGNAWGFTPHLVHLFQAASHDHSRHLAGTDDSAAFSSRSWLATKLEKRILMDPGTNALCKCKFELIIICT